MPCDPELVKSIVVERDDVALYVGLEERDLRLHSLGVLLEVSLPEEDPSSKGSRASTLAGNDT